MNKTPTPLDFEDILIRQIGAKFSKCEKYRYVLWRIWDKEKPLVMFIGLNPSSANESENDPTINKVCRIAKNNGYGGVFMLNCFPYISTDPTQMLLCNNNSEEFIQNDIWLSEIGSKCQDVVFAWGNFRVVKKMGRDLHLKNLFPKAKALWINKNGSPKHPLYCKQDIKLVYYNL